jgi:hypothetical protein
MSRGASTWFKMFTTMMWNLLIIEPFFIQLKKNQDWKLCLTMGVFLVSLESPHQVWFNKVDFIILRLKCEQYYWIFSEYCCWKFKKLRKGIWKENSIEYIQIWANDHYYILCLFAKGQTKNLKGLRSKNNLPYLLIYNVPYFIAALLRHIPQTKLCDLLSLRPP